MQSFLCDYGYIWKKILSDSEKYNMDDADNADFRGNFPHLIIPRLRLRTWLYTKLY